MRVDFNTSTKARILPSGRQFPPGTIVASARGKLPPAALLAKAAANRAASAPEPELESYLTDADITLESIFAEEREHKRRDPAGYAKYRAEQDAHSTISQGPTAKGYAEAKALIAKEEADAIAWDIECALHDWRLAVKEGKRDCLLWCSRESILARPEWPGVSLAEWERFQDAARTWLDPWKTPEAIAYEAQYDYEQAAESLKDPRTVDTRLLARVHDPANVAKLVHRMSPAKVEWLLRHRLQHKKKPDLWETWFPLLHARVFGQPPLKAAKAMPPASQSAIGLLTIRASDVTPTNVEWLMPGRIPRGKLSLVAGDQQLGKTTILLDIPARISRGAEWPCGEGIAPLGSVIYMGTEDDVSDTIVPRLMACGANLEKVHIVRAVRTEDGKGQRTFSLATDLAHLEKMIVEIGDVALVVVDPINSYFGRGADLYKTGDVRSILEPVAEMAARLNVAIIGNSHLGKDAKARSANMRILDSQAITAVARAINLVIPDPENPERRLFIRSKSNNAKVGLPALAYTLKEKFVVWVEDDPRKSVSGTYPEWASAHVAMTADEAFGLLEQKGRATPALDAAKAFLCEILASGPVEVKDVLKAAQSRCITSATLRIAAEALGIEREKLGMTDGWVWKLPPARRPTTTF